MIISARDNGNNRWKRNKKNKQKKKTKTEKNKVVAQAILKQWELNHFVVRLS